MLADKACNFTMTSSTGCHPALRIALSLVRHLSEKQSQNEKQNIKNTIGSTEDLTCTVKKMYGCKIFNIVTNSQDEQGVMRRECERL